MDMEPKIRKLEMIQGVITRMAQNSFALKGWAVTLVAGIFVLAAKDSKAEYFLIAYIPTIIFWFMDSYYLQLERKFRILYKKDSRKDSSEIDFDMTIPESIREDETEFYQSFFSRTECAFYLPLVILILIVTMISGIWLKG